MSEPKIEIDEHAVFFTGVFRLKSKEEYEHLLQPMAHLLAGSPSPITLNFMEASIANSQFILTLSLLVCELEKTKTPITIVANPVFSWQKKSLAVLKRLNQYIVLIWN